MATRTLSSKRSIRVDAKKYLTFTLGKDAYGVEILKVQEIIRLMEITEVPRAPGFVRGVINLRGEVIVVVDLRRKFGLPQRADTDRTCIIVLQVMAPNGQPLTRGVIVDTVSDVLDLVDEQLEPPPDLGQGVDVSFIRNVGKTDDRVVIILDVDRVLDFVDVLAPVTTTSSSQGGEPCSTT